MIPSRQRFLAVSLAAAVAVALTVVAAALIEQLGTAFLTGGRSDLAAGRATLAGSTAAPEKESSAMALHEAPRALPELRFEDGSGEPVTLADFGGKLVLLNIWATWCGPCRREMPTLDRLQAQLGGPGFEVVALSVDRAGIGAVRAFYDEIGVEHLATYIDVSGAAARLVGAVGLPTTLLVDRAGREIARHAGAAEWDGPAMVAFFRERLSGEAGPSRSHAGQAGSADGSELSDRKSERSE